MAVAMIVCRKYICFVMFLIVPTTFDLPSVVQKHLIKISPLFRTYPDTEDKILTVSPVLLLFLPQTGNLLCCVVGIIQLE
jgi:hypothetical protein